MNQAPHSAARLQKDAPSRLRAIPSVDELLGRPFLQELAQKSGRELVAQAVRKVLAETRAAPQGGDHADERLRYRDN